jgi:hypothetical protein
MDRRRFLALSTTSIAALTGCLGSPPQEETSNPTPTSNPAAPTDTSGKTETPETTETTPQHDSKGPVRCRGEPVSVEKTITDEPGYDDNIKYFPSNKTVRFVAARSRDRPVSFDTWTFKEWGRIETTEVGMNRAQEATADRLRTDDFSYGMGQPPDDAPTDKIVIWLEIGATYDRDGDTINTPTIEFNQLAEAAPRSVDTTVSLKGDEYTRIVPVYARSVTRQLD